MYIYICNKEIDTSDCGCERTIQKEWRLQDLQGLATNVRDSSTNATISNLVVIIYSKEKTHKHVGIPTLDTTRIGAVESSPHRGLPSRGS